ncbi:pyocin knob domain-containing protein, partial [Paenirhodobacter hankyongi]
RADALVAYIATLVADLNALVAEVNKYGDGFPLFIPTGSAAAPGLSFVGDGDTGLFRTGANAIGLATGGVERARITAAGLQLTGLLSGTAVVQSAADTTAGRLLTPGWMGLGATFSPALDNIDRYDIPQGFWSVSSATTLGTLPTGATVGDGVLVLRPTLNQTTQIYATPNNGQTWIRKSYSTTSWGPWRRLYDSGNVLGTVGQAAGVPTGALFETNTNAAGDYERQASGAQVCTMLVTSSASGPVTVTFPAAFAATTYRCAPAVNSATPCVVTISNRTLSGLDLSCWDLSGARVSKPVDLTIRGRWA